MSDGFDMSFSTSSFDLLQNEHLNSSGFSRFINLNISRPLFRLPLFRFEQGHKVGNIPQPLGDTCRHRWGQAQAPMNTNEIIREIVQGHSRRVILAQPRE